MTKKRELTQEERQMAARMRSIIRHDDNLTEESVGAIVGVSQGQVSHWTSGRNPVPARRAPKLAYALGIEDPGEISVAYRNVVPKAMQASKGTDMEKDADVASLQEQINELRRTLGVMTAVMAHHRPAEGDEVAKGLRRSVPAKFVRDGFVRELLEILDASASLKGSARASVRRSPKR